MATQVHHSYPLFEKNQVLTHSQLNQMVSYLEEQGRLTRIGLTGIGIVCGFKLKFVPGTESGTGKDTILMTEGAGITSEGYLIQLCDCEITKYREYPADEFGDYRPFNDPETGEYNLELLELLSDDFESENGDEINDLEDLDLSDKVMMLFIEMFDKNLKSCLSKGCDEIGVERRLNIRKLLVNKADLEKILERTGNEEIKLYPQRFELKDFTLKRAEFAPPFTQFDSLQEIGKPYADVLFAEENNPVRTLFEHWQTAWEAFRPVLSSDFEENPFSDINNKITQWEDLFAEEENHFGIQYYHDFVKDLILTYREFRQASFELLTQCCPDINLFPRHLLLGEITDECVPSEFRQQLILSPIQNGQKHLSGKTRSLFKRAVLMVEKFDERIVQNPDDFVLKVTPSAEKQSTLTERAIPYYFTEITEEGDRGSLEQNWNYDLVKWCATGEGALSYENNHSHNEGASVPDTAVYKPLHHDRSRFNFFRIEGGLGKPCSDVIATLNETIRRHNLPFDLVALRLNGDTEPVEVMPVDYSKGYHDLHEDYITFRYQLANFLKSGLEIWDWYQIFEEIARKKEEDFEPPFPDEAKEIFEQIYENIQTLLCTSLPSCVDEFTDHFEELKDNYSAIIEHVVESIFENLDPLDTAFFAEEIEAGTELNHIQELISIISRLVYQVLDRIFYHPLFRIYYAYRRREYFHELHYRNQNHTFSGFLEKHPGMEHGAGTPPGGTFIVVYGDHEENSQRVIADFMLPYRCCGKEEISIPLCDDDEARSNIRVAPYARPDFGFTYRDTPVVMNLLYNDHEWYDRENEYCVPDEEVVRNLAIRSIEPVNQNDARAELQDERGSVLITPPEGFTGILKFRYVAEKRSNGMQDEGIVTVLVTDRLIRMTDFEFETRIEETVTAGLEDFPDFVFEQTDHNEEVVRVENRVEVLAVTLLRTIEDRYSFNYLAHNEETGQRGVGTITLNMRRQEEELEHHFELTVRLRETVEVVLEEFPGFMFRETDHEEDLVNIQNHGEVLIITLIHPIPEPHTFTFVAVNDRTGQMLSGSITLHLEREEIENPTIRIRQPENEATFAVEREIPTEFELTNIESISTIELHLNSEQIGETTADEDFQFVVGPLESGTYNLVARAIDLNGNFADEDQVTFFVAPRIERGNINNHLEDFTVNDLRNFLENRNITFTRGDNKESLINRLSPSLSEQPLTRNELESADEFSVNRLMGSLNVDPSAGRSGFINSIDFNR